MIYRNKNSRQSWRPIFPSLFPRWNRSLSSPNLYTNFSMFLPVIDQKRVRTRESAPIISLDRVRFRACNSRLEHLYRPPIITREGQAIYNGALRSRYTRGVWRRFFYISVRYHKSIKQKTAKPASDKFSCDSVEPPAANLICATAALSSSLQSAPVVRQSPFFMQIFPHVTAR